MSDSFKIPSDIFDTDLLRFLNSNRFEDTLTIEKVKLLHKICFCKISSFGRQVHIDDMSFTEDEYNIIIDNDWQNNINLEIKARCCDILKKREKDKRRIIIKASDAYLEVFRLTEGMDYLERAASIRSFKQVNNDDFLKVILIEIFIKTLKHPFWLSSIVEVLLMSYSIEKLSNLIIEIEKCVQEKRGSKEYGKERDYIDILHLLNNITKQEQYKLKALSFETEADEIWNNQENNTVYPNLPDLYRNAYQEINKINSIEPEIHKRIREKLIRANKYLVEILSKVGVSYKMPFLEEEKKRIEKWIADEKWESPLDFIALLHNIPFASKENTEKYMDISRKGSVLSSMMRTNRLDDKGNTIGLDNPENSLRTDAHIYYRQKILYTLWTCIDKAANMKLLIEEDMLFYIMKNRIPYFLQDEDRLIFWVKGLTSGFNKDFMIASHILIPQIEWALRNIAEIYHGSLVKLEEERQEEATLGSILKQLENVMHEEIRFEVESFLQSGIDVNFRNKLSHGLLSSFEIMQYGIFLWWLCIKLFFDIDRIVIDLR
jgi:hypothetical protein